MIRPTPFKKKPNKNPESQLRPRCTEIQPPTAPIAPQMISKISIKPAIIALQPAWHPQITAQGDGT
jgi:hypothetical protein